MPKTLHTHFYVSMQVLFLSSRFYNLTFVRVTRIILTTLHFLVRTYANLAEKGYFARKDQIFRRF